MLPEQSECPCGTGNLTDRCCGPLLRGELRASTAEQLMRSRYSAYVARDHSHLFGTWHPRTRPAEVSTPDVEWLGLTLLDVVDGGPDDQDGVVEFEARLRAAGADDVLHERSTFTRRAGRWLYVDAEQPVSAGRPGGSDDVAPVD